MLKILSPALIITLLCNTAYTQTHINEVTPITNSIDVNGTQIFYSLPKNAIEITLSVNITEHYKGPYSAYSQKYLNITDGVILRDAMLYNIEKAELNRLSYPDSSKLYCLKINNENPPFIQLNPDGVILGCNVQENIEGYNIYNPQLVSPQINETNFAFTDLGTKSFLTEKPITLYKTIPTDSVPRKVAYIKEQLVETSTEENAAAAAAFIRKIRKRRLKIIAAMEGEVTTVSNDNLEISIAEINKLENEYIALFTGKTFEYNQTVKVIFEPSHIQETEQKIIAWFSPTEGITTSKPSNKRNDYEPILINITPTYSLPETKVLTTDNTQKTPTTIKYGLYNQIPGNVNITLQLIDKKLAVQQFQIAQKGKTIPLPATYINNSKYGIEFYPETGMVKRIHSY